MIISYTELSTWATLDLCFILGLLAGEGEQIECSLYGSQGRVLVDSLFTLCIGLPVAAHHTASV